MVSGDPVVVPVPSEPPDPLDAWVSPPFEPAIRNGRIYACGAGDNKGQHFAQLLALEATLAVHGALPCNVIFEA